jgi:hypothetical protein
MKVSIQLPSSNIVLEAIRSAEIEFSVGMWNFCFDCSEAPELLPFCVELGAVRKVDVNGIIRLEKALVNHLHKYADPFIQHIIKFNPELLENNA